MTKGEIARWWQLHRREDGSYRGYIELMHRYTDPSGTYTVYSRAIEITRETDATFVCDALNKLDMITEQEKPEDASS